MIIAVKEQSRIGAQASKDRRWYYNAPNDIKIGDLVELPDASNTGTWVGVVTQTDAFAAATLRRSGYDGPIKAIVRKATTLKIELEANTRSAMRRKLVEALEDLDDEGGWAV